MACTCCCACDQQCHWAGVLCLLLTPCDTLLLLLPLPVLQVYNGTTPAAPNKNRSGSICYDFVKGVCTRGSECRYSHDLTLIARMARGSSGEDSNPGQQADVCFDYLRWGGPPVSLQLLAALEGRACSLQLSVQQHAHPYTHRCMHML